MLLIPRIIEFRFSIRKVKKKNEKRKMKDEKKRKLARLFKSEKK